MTTHDKLPDSLMFEDGGANAGHLTDVALTAIADGQTDILTAAALAHFETCSACAEGVGDAALLSVQTAELLSLVTAASAAPEALRAKTPFGAVSLAIAVAILAAGPMAYGVWTHASAVLHLGVQLLTMFSHLTVVVSRGSPELSQVRLIGSYGSAAMLLLMGFAVARTQTHAAWK